MDAKKLSLTAGLLIVLVAIAVTDAVLTGKQYFPEKEEITQEPTPTPPTPPTPSPPTEPTIVVQSSSSVASEEPKGVKPGVRRQSGPDVKTILVNHQFTFNDTNELAILRTVVPQGEADVNAIVLLKDNDRTAFFAWTKTPNVKKYFLALKEALHTSFSPEVRDLIDETQREKGRPTRNLLTFLDPNISEERFVFVRVREHLFEFHIAPGADDAVFELIETLSQ